MVVERPEMTQIEFAVALDKIRRFLRLPLWAKVVAIVSVTNEVG